MRTAKTTTSRIWNGNSGIPPGPVFDVVELPDMLVLTEPVLVDTEVDDVLDVVVAVFTTAAS